MNELEGRLGRLRIPLYACVLWTLQSGWWLTHDSFDLAPRLPIVFSAIASILILRHGFTALTWARGPRKRAFLHVGIIATLLVLAVGVNLQNARMDIAGKITVCVFCAVSIFYVGLFTSVVFRIGDRGKKKSLRAST